MKTDDSIICTSVYVHYIAICVHQYMSFGYRVYQPVQFDVSCSIQLGIKDMVLRPEAPTRRESLQGPVGCRFFDSLKKTSGIQCVAALGNVIVEVDGLDAPLDALDEGGALDLVSRGKRAALMSGWVDDECGSDRKDTGR